MEGCSPSLVFLVLMQEISTFLELQVASLHACAGQCFVEYWSGDPAHLWDLVSLHSTQLSSPVVGHLPQLPLTVTVAWSFFSRQGFGALVELTLLVVMSFRSCDNLLELW